MVIETTALTRNYAFDFKPHLTFFKNLLQRYIYLQFKPPLTISQVHGLSEPVGVCSLYLRPSLMVNHQSAFVQCRSMVNIVAFLFQFARTLSALSAS